MPIGVQQFQIPTFEQANPVLTGASAGQQLISNMLAQRLAHLQAQTEQAKLPYVGPTSQAELISKQLQNKITQPYAEQAGPFAAAALEQAKAQPGLTNAQAQHATAQAQQIQFGMKHPGLAVGGLPAMIELMNMGKISPNLSSQMGIPSGNVPSTQVPMSQPTQLPGTQPSGTQPAAQAVMPPPVNAAPVGASTYSSLPQQSPASDIAQPINYNFGIQPIRQPVKTGYGPMVDAMFNSQIPLTQDQELQKKKNEITLQQNMADYDKHIQEGQDAYKNNLGIQEQLNKFLNNYNQLGPAESGPLSTINPFAWSDARQQAIQAENSLIPMLALKWQKQHITNANIELQKRAKLSTSMGADAVSNEYKFMTDWNSRGDEYVPFKNYMLGLGVPDKVSEQIWDNYNTQRKPYNSLEDISQKQYLNTWHDYATPQAINTAMKGLTYTPPNQKDLEKTILSDKDIKEIARKEKKPVALVRRKLREKGYI